mgnify:CR=1 FL=1
MSPLDEAIGGVFLGQLQIASVELEHIGLLALPAVVIGGIQSLPGAVVGGFLVEEVSWQSIFLLNVPVAVAAIAASGSFKP